MGGCATKPKVLKGEEGEVPAPPPPNPAVPEEKEAVGVVTDEVEADEVVKDKDVDKAKEVVIDDTIDDHSNKRRSLSNLFKEKEKKGTGESDNTPSEPMKKETLESMLQESLETVERESLEPVEPVTMNQETKEPEKHIEPVSVPPGNIESAQLIEAKLAPEVPATTAAAVNVPVTQYKETSVGEKKDDISSKIKFEQ